MNCQLRIWLVALSIATMSVSGFAQAPSLQQLSAEVASLKAKLATLEAEAPTTASAVNDATSRLTVLEQRLAVVEKQRLAIPEAVVTIDALTADLLVIRADIEALRTRLADFEQPAVGAGGTAADYDDGFNFRSSDGLHGLHLGGYFQFRLDTLFAEDAAGDLDYASSTLAIRRARVDIGARVGVVDLSMVIDPLLTSPLLDYFVEAPLYRRGDRWSLTGRFGQYRAPFTRNFSTRARDTLFSERPSAVEDLRYDRSPSVGIEASLFGDKLWAYLGVSNGAGRNNVNDNLELATTLRVEGAVLGERPRYGYGDTRRSEQPVLVLGAGVVHDLAAIPATIAGADVGVLDVDGDGEDDNVRVISVSADALFRLRGLELGVEGIYRHERWGTFFDHPDNTAVGDLFEFDDNRNYIGFYGDASYLVSDRYLVAIRGGHNRRAPLRLDGRPLALAPRSARVAEGRVALSRLLQSTGRRFWSIEYTYRNHNNKDAPEVPNDEEHRLVYEINVVW